jgi:hypothetical protein
MTYHITAVGIMNEAAREALVPLLKPPYSRLRTAEEQETLTSEKWLSPRKKNMLSMHEIRKKWKLSLSCMVHRIFPSVSH